MRTPRHLWKNKRFTKLLIRNFLLWSFVFGSLIMGMLVLSHWNSVQIVREQVGESNQLRLSQQIRNVDKQLHSLSIAMLRLMNTEDVRQYFRLEPSDRSSYSEIQLRQRIYESLRHQTGYESESHTLYVYNEALGELISSDIGVQSHSLLHDHSWLDAYGRMKSGETVEAFVRTLDDRYGYMKVLTLMQSYPLLINGTRKGAVIANLDIQTYFDAMMLGNPYLVTDRDGALMCANRLPDGLIALNAARDVLGQAPGSRMLTLNGRQVLVSAQQSPAYGWWFYSVDLLENYNSRIRAFNRMMIALCLAALALVMAFSYLLSVRMFVPIKHIMHLLEEQENEMLIPADEQRGRNSEMAFLADAVTHTLDRNRELSTILEERLQKLNQIRLRMLQSQIDPHFLYNVLASINWMALEKLPDDNEISDALCSLSELLRDRLKHTGFISLAEEMRQVRRYASLQRLSLGEKLQMDDQTEREAQTSAVPSMIMQLLVENAIKHGLDREGDQVLHVCLGAWTAGDHLHLRVTDDGLGMARGELETLKHKLEQESGEPGRSIGLYNIRQQLRLLFEDRALLMLDSEEGQSFKVEIVIPNVQISDLLKKTESL